MSPPHRRRTASRRLAIRVVATVCLITFAGALPAEVCGIYCAVTHGRHPHATMMGMMPCHQGTRHVSAPMVLSIPLSPALPVAGGAPVADDASHAPSALATVSRPELVDLVVDVPPPRT